MSSPDQGWCPTPAPPRSACRLDVLPPPQRPDLAIYSQDEQFGLGVAPTWDNPDIAVQSFADMRVIVRNISTVSAVNAQVSLSVSGYGIGFPLTPVGVQRVSLGGNQGATLVYAASGPLPYLFYAALYYVTIAHPFDLRPINNQGARNLVVQPDTPGGASQHRARFPVFNDSPTSREISLSVLPNEVSARVTPASHVFAPIEQFEALLDISIPDRFHGTPGAPLRADATVVARAPGGGVIGGITFRWLITS